VHFIRNQYNAKKNLLDSWPYPSGMTEGSGGTDLGVAPAHILQSFKNVF